MPSKFVVYSVSTVLLFISLLIFAFFKSLRCLRNAIHFNLILACTFFNLSWFVQNFHKKSILYSISPYLCDLVIIVEVYFHSCIFYWMFVEGLFLFILTVWAFSTHQLLLWHFLVIGWGTPLLVTAIWVLVHLHLEGSVCWVLRPQLVDLIVSVPIAILLICNGVFMFVIITMVIKKLRERQTSNITKYKKTAKAALMLIPLLGITYLLYYMVPPDKRHGSKNIMDTSSVLEAIQGIVVVVIYCFGNAEVQDMVIRRFSDFRSSIASTTDISTTRSRMVSKSIIVNSGISQHLEHLSTLSERRLGEVVHVKETGHPSKSESKIQSEKMTPHTTAKCTLQLNTSGNIDNSQIKPETIKYKTTTDHTALQQTSGDRNESKIKLENIQI